MRRPQCRLIRSLAAVAVPLAATVLLGGGCVSLQKYDLLLQRFERQERWAERHLLDVAQARHAEEVSGLELQRRTRDQHSVEHRLKIAEDRLARARKEADVAILALQEVEEAPEDDVWASFATSNGEATAFVLDGSVLFPAGFAVLTSLGKAEVDKVASRLLASDLSPFRLRVEGHTDATPIRKSGFKDNWQLSTARARAVLLRLIEQGVDAARLSCAGYGPHSPVDPGTTKAARARNRRVEIVLVPPTFEAAPIAEETIAIAPLGLEDIIVIPAQTAPAAEVPTGSDAESPR